MEKVLGRMGYDTLRDQIVQVLQAGKERAQRAEAGFEPTFSCL